MLVQMKLVSRGHYCAIHSALDAHAVTLAMPERIYFDTTVFREVGKAFEKQKMSEDLRERILISPITLFEVWSQLTITNAEDVLHQIHAVHNWTNPQRTGLIAWPDDALFGIWFQKPAPDADFTKKMQTAFNVCLATDSAKLLQEEAGKLKDVMDGMKLRTAQDFGRLVDAARKEPLEGDKFSVAWFRGIANRVKADPTSKTVAEILSALNAYHEFEEAKLRIAVQSKDYNPEKHRNDLFDAEQLIYLSDPSLGFLTCDTGFQNLVKKSPQAARITTVPPADLADGTRVETLLRKIVGG
jgi:hypothetical protein